MATGIDYGMGQTNIDKATGIRYGVISQHSVLQAWADSIEAEYGEPHCPKCGNANAVSEIGDTEVDYEAFGGNVDCDDYEDGPGCADFACHACKYVFDSSEAYSDEPLGFTLDDGEYQASDCLDSDIIITHSPYYTYGPFCSPCVPGAINLDGAKHWMSVEHHDGHTGGTKAYCFGHDWFEDGKAPYRVFRVADDSEVIPAE